MNNKTYSTKEWLNPMDSYANSYIACFDGDVVYNNKVVNTKFISISTCDKIIKIYETEDDTLEEYVNKLKKIEYNIRNYIKHLVSEEDGYNVPMTHKITDIRQRTGELIVDDNE